jgi:hypothetical protein
LRRQRYTRKQIAGYRWEPQPGCAADRLGRLQRSEPVQAELVQDARKLLPSGSNDFARDDGAITWGIFKRHLWEDIRKVPPLTGTCVPQIGVV